MADSRLTDLNAVTLAADNDVIYLVDTSAGTSNKISFSNFTSSILTNSEPFSSTVITPLTGALTNITALQSDTINNNQSISALQTDVIRLSTGGGSETISSSTVNVGSFSTVAASIADNGTYIQDLTVGNISAGDILDVFPSGVDAGDFILNGLLGNGGGLSAVDSEVGKARVFITNLSDSTVNLTTRNSFAFIATRNFNNAD
tara:strand:+ start:3395 stop:4003 length:609 start_codon:yes stop_codon:yes gene_type:complete